MSNPAGQPIPEDVRRFILEHVDSVPALEALLLMRRSPDKRWTVPMMAAALYMDPRRVAALLTDLRHRELCGGQLDREPIYVWHPATPEMAATLDRLAETYRYHLVAVTNLIHEKPRASVRGFSDAFRLRGGEP